MKHRVRYLGFVLVVASVVVVLSPIARAAGDGQPAAHPLAGPWYTPHELEALIVYSKASVPQRKVLLAATGVTGKTAAADAGRRYTPQELQALIAYSKASFAQKQVLLAGGNVAGLSANGSFHWGDAAIGAGSASGSLLLALGLAAWLTRTRRERRAPQHA